MNCLLTPDDDIYIKITTVCLDKQQQFYYWLTQSNLTKKSIDSSNL